MFAAVAGALTRGAASRSVAQGRQKLGQALRATPGLVPAWRLGRSTIRRLPRPLREEALDVLSRAGAVLATPGIRGKLRSEGRRYISPYDRGLATNLKMVFGYAAPWYVVAVTPKHFPPPPALPPVPPAAMYHRRPETV